MKLRNILLTAAGIFLLGFGTVGVFVPILPTTPFVIGASACFVVNPRMHSWLFKIKFFHEHFINYQNRTGLQKNTVVVSLGFLWG